MSEELKKLKAALASKSTPEAFKSKLKARIDAIEAKDSEPKKETAPAKPKKKRDNAAGAAAGASRMKLAGEIHKKNKASGMTWPQAMKEASRQQAEAKNPKPKAKKLVRKATPIKKAVKKFVRKAKSTPAKKSKKKIVRLVGASDRAIDKTIKAKKAGKRISRTGNTYYETRRNRADADQKKKL